VMTVDDLIALMTGERPHGHQQETSFYSTIINYS